MQVASKLAICQRALAKIKAGQITSYDESGSLEARECRRFYPQVIASMLEGPNDWSFAIQRVRLAAVATDREHEWVYAYAIPTNMAQPITVVPDLDAMGLSLPVALPGSPYAETWATNGIHIETPYIIHGRTLYSNVENATLEYVVNDIEGIAIGARCASAIATELAAHLAVPVKGDSQREQTLFSQAEVEWQRAIAEDRNRQPQQSGDYISEAMAVRHGNIAP